MMKLCFSVPDIKLTRERQKSTSGWANPYQTRKGGKRVTKPGNKKYGKRHFGSNRKGNGGELFSVNAAESVSSPYKLGG